MKRTLRYNVNNETVEREVNYIPVRYIIAVLITVLEVGAVIGIVVALCYYVPYFYIAAWLTEIGCMVRIISSDDNPDYKVPWLLLVMIVPIAGFMLYFLFYSRKLQRKYRKRLGALKHQAYSKNDAPEFDALEQDSPLIASQARMLCGIGDTHLFTNTKQTYFPLGEDMFVSLLEDLRAAEKFIYMEYFIIEDGKFWGSILEILKEKASQGLDIKVLYDDVGCMMTLPGDYCKTLRSYGIQAPPSPGSGAMPTASSITGAIERSPSSTARWAIPAASTLQMNTSTK